MTDQIKDGLIERLPPLLAATGGAVVLERVARGGGNTRWFHCRTMAEVGDVLSILRPGSRVGFFFDNRIRREPFSEDIRGQMIDIATAAGEVLLGRERPSRPELDMDFLGPDEIGERLASVPPGKVVYFGVFPSTDDDDGVSAVSYRPPDQDGVVRPQPT